MNLEQDNMYIRWSSRITKMITSWILNDEVIYDILKNVIAAGPLTEDIVETFVWDTIEHLENPPDGIVGDLVSCALEVVDWNFVVNEINKRED